MWVPSFAAKVRLPGRTGIPSSVITRNSPLWISNPKQQIAYLALKYWARLYCPAVVLGVYTPDEVEQRTEKEINPAPQRVSLADISGDTVTTTLSAQESSVNIGSLADDFRERIDAAQDVDSAKALRADIESAKVTLGSALFTELKNKAVKRYYLVDSRNKVEAAINSYRLRTNRMQQHGLGKLSEFLQLRNVIWATSCTISSASPWRI